LGIKESGLADAVCEFAGCGGIVFGICGGYQMLGKSISDPDGVESEAKGGSEPKGIKTEGLGLLSVSTRLEKQKKRKQVSVKAEDVKGFFDFLNGKTIEGYEIHQGKSVACGVEGASSCDYASFPSGACRDNVYGSYIHGFFDSGDIALCTIKALAERKGITVDFGSCIDYKAFKESQYDLLADTLRKSLDMNAIYKILGISGKKEACDE
jgi:adenosylcobyric acid synthase